MSFTAEDLNMTITPLTEKTLANGNLPSIEQNVLGIGVAVSCVMLLTLTVTAAIALVFLFFAKICKI